MATVPVLLACRRDFFTPAAILDTFSLAGAFLQSYDYSADLPMLGDLECPFECVDGSVVMSAALERVARVDTQLAFVSSTAMTAPAGTSFTTPQFYPNIPVAATRVIGLWQNSGGFPFNSTVQDIDPDTLAQTALWVDFQGTLAAPVAGCGLSRDGLTWYYINGTGTIYALNLTTGVSTAFITPPATGSPTNTGTYPLYQLADNTFLVLWTIGGTSLRLMQYSVLGVASGIDISLTGVLTNAGVFAPDVDGSGVWVLGQNPTFTNNVLRRYAIPGGALDVNTTTPDAAADYCDLLAGTIGSEEPEAMSLYTLAPCGYQTIEDSDGSAVAGGKVRFRVAGEQTLATTWQDANGDDENTNPIVANGAGRFVAFLLPGTIYDVDYMTDADVIFHTVEGMAAVPFSAANVDVSGVAGEALTAGQAVYLSDGSGSKTAGQWFKADADNTYSSTLPILGMVPTDIASQATGNIRLYGRMTSLSGLTPGTTYYVSATAGSLTSSAPTNARVVGVADTTTSLVLSTGASGSGGGGSSSSNVITATAGEAITAGASVYISDGSGSKTAGKMYLADADLAYGSVLSVIVGVAVSAITNGASGDVTYAGLADGLSGLTAGLSYYISATAGALTTTRPPNARLLGIAQSTTSLLLNTPGDVDGHTISYPATLAQVLNTVTETTVLSFVIPPNLMSDGDVIRVQIPTLAKNNKGSGGTVLAKVNVGAGAQVSLPTYAPIDSATEFDIVMGFLLQRQGAVVLVEAAPGVFAGSAWTTIASSTPANFTAAQTVSLKLTLSAADTTFYIKPQCALVLHERN